MTENGISIFGEGREKMQKAPNRVPKGEYCQYFENLIVNRKIIKYEQKMNKQEKSRLYSRLFSLRKLKKKNKEVKTKTFKTLANWIIMDENKKNKGQKSPIFKANRPIVPKT